MQIVFSCDKIFLQVDLLIASESVDELFIVEFELLVFLFQLILRDRFVRVLLQVFLNAHDLFREGCRFGCGVGEGGDAVDFSTQSTLCEAPLGRILGILQVAQLLLLQRVHTARKWRRCSTSPRARRKVK